jgi:hypothetical protein
MPVQGVQAADRPARATLPAALAKASSLAEHGDMMMKNMPSSPLSSHRRGWSMLGRQAAALLLLPVLGACAAPPAPTTVLAAPVAASADLLRQIQTEIGDAACNSDAQCRTLAIGAKPCGGPESYLAWSTQRGRADRLERLATDYRQQREAENQREGRLSNCLFVIDPGAQCKASRCQLGSGTAGGGGQLR